MIPNTPFASSASLMAVPVAALAFHLNGQLLPGWMLVGFPVLALIGSVFPGTRLHPRLFRLRPWLFWSLLSLSFAGWQAQSALQGRLTPELEGQSMVLRGWVSAMPLKFEQGQRYRFWVSACDLANCPAGQIVRLNWYAGFKGSVKEGDPPPTLQAGEDLCLRVKLKRPLSTLNPWAFDSELRSLEEGVSAVGSIRARVPCEGVEWRQKSRQIEGLGSTVSARLERGRTFLRDRLRASMDEARSSQNQARPQLTDVAKATIVALVVGEQSAIPNTWWTIFNLTGVGHLMSISGLHITLFAGIALAVLKFIFRQQRLAGAVLRLGLQPLRLSWILAVIAAFAYSLISGWGIPAQRTCWMLACAAWALNSGRSKSMSSVLALAAAVVTAMDPWAPMAPGFWLSFAAVAALIWFGSREHLSPEHWFQLAWRAQVAATLALAPMGALFFGSFSVVGPLANAFAIPFVSSVLTPYVLGCGVFSLIWQGGAALLLVPALVATEWMLVCLKALSGLSWASFGLSRPGSLALMLATLACLGLLAPFRIRWRWPFAMGLIPLLTAPVAGPAAGELWLSIFDVGQGMSVLIETKGRRLLYDAGPSYGSDSEAGSRIIIPYLQARGLKGIDALIVSHQDSDHAGGAREVIRRLRPAWVSSSIAAGFQGAEHVPCREGQSWQWGEAEWRFLHPAEINMTAVKSSSNARSCVLRLRHPAVSVLLPGDLEKAQERRLVNDYGAKDLRADVLLAPHHGSAGSSSGPFLEAVSPRWAVFQVGYRNRFKHPSEKALARYQKQGIGILRSDHHGFIQMKFRVGKEPEIIRWRLLDRPYWRLQAGEE